MLSRLSPLRARFYSTGSPSTLIFAEHNNKALSGGTLAAITAAQKIGGPVTAFICGSSADEAVAQLRKVEGVSKVIASKDSKGDSFLPEVMSKMLVSLQSSHNFTHIMGPHSAVSKNVLPRLAALLDVQQISEILEVKSHSSFLRPLYAGNALATVESSDKVKVITVRHTAFPKAGAGGQEAPLEEYKGEVPDASDMVKFIEAQIAKNDRPELTSAEKVVAGGRALKSAENFKLIYDLADKMGAAVGASRAAVDAGYVSNDLQIGQTGKTVAPGMYLAVGISGAIQHVAGMKDSKVIAAINKDPEAPIFHISDYGLVADLFQAVPEMTNKL